MKATVEKPVSKFEFLAAASFCALPTFVLPPSAENMVGSAVAAELTVEKVELKFCFIKLTDMAPLAVGFELFCFEEDRFFVTLEPLANRKVELDRVVDVELDGAHMLTGQPLGATVGFGTKAGVITGYKIPKNSPEKVFGEKTGSDLRGSRENDFVEVSLPYTVYDDLIHRSVGHDIAQYFGTSQQVVGAPC